MPHTLEAQTEVLAFYRRMRRAGMRPHRAITEVRHAYADRIASDVARCQPIDGRAVACWQQADAYAKTMLDRTPYWWRLD